MKQAAEKLLCQVRKRMQLEDALLGAFSNSDKMQIVINPSGEILKVNEMWSEVLNYTSEEMEGHYFWDFIVEEMVEKAKDLFLNRKKNTTGKRSDVYYDIPYINKEGGTVNLRWNPDYEDINGTLIASCFPI